MKSGTCFHFGFFSVILVTCVVTGTGVVIDCYSTTVNNYTGHQQTTKNGTPCIRWDSLDDYDFINKQFNDVTVSDAANFCRAVGKDFLWCLTSNSGSWDKCGIEKCDNNGIRKCGNLKIEQPALVGRNVTFTFTPDSHDPDAILEWQRATEAKRYSWYTRPLTHKFIQYNQNGIYYMVLTNSVPKGDELYYRIHYYNESMHCWMEAGKLELDDNDVEETENILHSLEEKQKIINDLHDQILDVLSTDNEGEIEEEVITQHDYSYLIQSTINKIKKN
ncbi:uncharacterized protein LOC132717586 [Ruditapes philippinarum]|uniref:uncharacterized protein LOC132717586 n=1 Tax=Ruditapes philippinarum TaxID=129788 RepID=UPI00295A6FA7|nr:uncharacterized protein LOC132717586 [Ruditapes philippinarum]